MNRPIVDIARTPEGNGYWFVAADGGISAFGDARYLGGATRDLRADTAIDIAARPVGKGYWIASDS